MSAIAIVITDLDNTIYNWVDFYVPSYLAMVRELAAITGISVERLNASFKRLHERYRTSEYSLAVHQLDVLSDLNKGLTAREVREKYSSAIRAFQGKRKQTLRLYDGVQETLERLKARGKRIVAHSDALLFHAARRLRQLGVEELYDAIFAPPDHGFPEGVRPEDVRYYDDATMYESSIPIQVAIDPRVRKPDPAALRIILDRMGVAADEAVYVGDSITRDIVMAQRCGVYDVHAKYGEVHEPENYAELVKITYWNNSDFALERELKKLRVVPTFEIEKFPDLVGIVDTLECGVIVRNEMLKRRL